MRIYFTLAAVYLFQSGLWAQLLTGKIMDAETHQPLSYVNIGIPGKDKGTVANPDGTFRLYIPAENSSDSLRFSLIGYASYSVVISSFLSKTEPSDKIIYLKSKVTELKEVTVTPGNYDKETIGSTKRSLLLRMGIGPDSIGSEMGTVIRVKHKPSLIESATFNIQTNNYAKKIKLRLNFYQLNKDVPGASLLQRPIYIETSLKKGSWKVDLTEYNLEVNDDFFMALEYVENLGYQGLYFHCGYNKVPTYFKTTSQSTWKLFTNGGKYISPNFTAEVSFAKQ